MCDSPEGVSILARIEGKGKPLREDVQLLKAAVALSASVTFSSRSETCSGRCSSPVLNKAVILNQKLAIRMFLFPFHFYTCSACKLDFAFPISLACFRMKLVLSNL